MEPEESSAHFSAALREVIELVSRSRDLSQDSPAIREFNFAATSLIAALSPGARPGAK